MTASVNVAPCAGEIVSLFAGKTTALLLHLQILSLEDFDFQNLVVFFPSVLFLVTKTVYSRAFLCLVTSNNLQFLDNHLHLPKLVQQTKAIMI